MRLPQFATLALAMASLSLASKPPVEPERQDELEAFKRAELRIAEYDGEYTDLFEAVVSAMDEKNWDRETMKTLVKSAERVMTRKPSAESLECPDRSSTLRRVQVADRIGYAANLIKIIADRSASLEAYQQAVLAPSAFNDAQQDLEIARLWHVDATDRFWRLR